jgi:CBS domain-containing protein
MPVLSERRLITGIVTQHGIEKALLEKTGAGDSTRIIGDVMSPEVITADPITDIRRIVKLLLDFHMNAVPIVNDQDLLIGIVSRKDVLRAVINDPPLRLFT